MFRKLVSPAMLLAAALLGPSLAAAQTESKSPLIPTTDHSFADGGQATTDVPSPTQTLNLASASSTAPPTTYYEAGSGNFCPPGQGLNGPECATDHWWVVAPYVWIPGLKGQITTFGVTRNVSIDTSDILNHLHDANGALQLHLESGVDRVGIIVDTSVMRLSQTTTLGAGTAKFYIQQTLLEVLGMYRLLETSAEGSSNQTTSVDLLAGGRYYNFTNGLTLTPFDPTLPVAPLGQSATWVDMVIGARGRTPLAAGLDGFFRADFGGFGIGTSSSLAWNLIAGLDWRPSDHLSLLAGYRVLDIDESKGEGASRFAFDAKMQGPFVAFAFQY